MRLFVSGSAPLPARVLEEFEGLFGHRILERYGMTETLMNLSNPYEGERRAGSVGRPLPGVEVRLVDHDGRDVAEGETGEVYLKGPNVFAGYWRQEEATRRAFDDGWFRTGDLGTRSGDGYYTLCGRRTDLIVSGGFNIYPREIESVLESHPAVGLVAVLGVADGTFGEVGHAFVELLPGREAAASDLKDWCAERLANYKVPKTFSIRPELPRLPIGKIDKQALKKELADLESGETSAQEFGSGP
jgi:malonyl-CoA/methylmalonyl-CoA synthetase